MPVINQSNQITLREIHTRPELWKDKIYYLERNPYWNKSYDFLPIPKKYAEIIQEFHQEIDKQKKDQEEAEEIKQEAQTRINEIYLEIKEIIQQIIQTEEEEPLMIEWEPGAEEDNQTKQEFIKELTEKKQQRIKNLKLGLTKKNLGQFSKWANDNQITEIKLLLDEWKEREGEIKKNYNSCFILEHNQETLKFTFQPPRQVFINLNEFLFYRSNTWYEVVSWERINNWNAVITCQRSKFLSYYVYFLQKGINGVLHNSPRIAQEICQCPAFLESTITEEYKCDWEPRYELWRIESAGGTKTAIPKGDETYMPYLSSVSLKKVEDIRGWDDFFDTTYCILPKGYNDHRTWWSDTNSAKGKKITFSNQQHGLLSEDNWAQHTNNELNSHTKKHVAVQLFWRKKLLGGPYSLKDFNLKECYLKIKANGASILYTLQSNNIIIRWSEDIKTTIEKDRMAGGLMNMVEKWSGFGLNQATNSLFHDQNTTESKASEEREGERKTKYTGASKVVASTIASIPSMFASNHTKMDYTFAEICLRYEQPSLLVRLQYNNVLFDRYKMEKVLKRNGNEWVNWDKVGNYLNRGYWKIIPHVFEGDKESFFAGIFSKGAYLYENDPHEYFLEKLTGGKYSNNVLVGGNPQIESVFQKDLEETGGHDNVSQAGGGLWVYKSSYIRRQDGAGGNVFETLMNQVNSYRNHSYEDSGKWVFKHPQTWSTELNMDEYAVYVYDLNFYSSDHKNTHGVKGATKIVAEQIAEGNRSTIKVRFIGELEIRQGQDDPNEIGSSLPGGTEVEEMPEIEQENNDDVLNDLEKQEEEEGEKGNEKQDEIQDELEPEPEEQKQDEKQEELEQEDEKSKDKQKQKQKQKEKQQEDEQQDEPEYSRQNEK